MTTGGVSAPCVHRLDRAPDLVEVSRTRPEHFPYLLHSAACGPLGRHSLLLFAEGEALSARGGQVEGPGQGKGFFQRLSSWIEDTGAAPGADGLPFAGGWFVYLGYEIASEIEPRLRLPEAPPGLPDAFARRCPGAVVVLHEDTPEDGERAVVVAESPAVLQRILAALDGVSGQPPRVQVEPPALLELVEETPERFKGSVRRIREYLAAGDVFQVNISRPWRGRFAASPDPYALYGSLCQANPAPFAGLVRWNDAFLLSSSPERLVQIRGDTVQTRPIAGTRARGQDHAHDRFMSEELISNLKERAEHVMLIDLERNDLGRICRPGSIEVNELMVVESYAHVHHIVSNVRGTLLEGAGPVEAMQAVFPGGTITGCPKVRCMEIIAELEGEGRGCYTGSFGYVGRDGCMDLNILIRSLLLLGSDFSFRTGAGIVIDSDPERELEETAEKARGMTLAVERHAQERTHD